MVIAGIAVFILDIDEAGPPRDFYLVLSRLSRIQMLMTSMVAFVMLTPRLNPTQ